MALIDFALKVFNEETEKYGGQRIELSFLPTKEEYMLKKVVDFCEDKNYNIENFIRSRFFALNNWAKEKLSYKTLPASMLLNPNPDQIYQQYIDAMDKRYNKRGIPSFVDLKVKLQMEDAEYNCFKYKILPIDYLQNQTQVYPCYVATDNKFIDLVKTGAILKSQIPNTVFSIWKNREKYIQLKIIRSLVCQPQENCTL